MKFKHIPPLAALLTSAALLLPTTSCGFIIVNDMTSENGNGGTLSDALSAETEKRVIG